MVLRCDTRDHWYCLLFTLEQCIMRYQKQLTSLFSVFKYGCLLLSLLVCLFACKANLAPVEDINRPPPKLSGTHTVKPDETLYSISWRYSRDYKDLAAVNHIAEPYSIQPGQVLSLASAKKTTVVTAAVPAPAPISPIVTPMQERDVGSTPTKNVAQATAQTETQKNKNNTTTQKFSNTVVWRWPADGKVQGYFAQTKGINIAGKKGSPIKAAAKGRVVYSGSGLRGYGKLLIIKHNDRLLSAYAHNDALYVKEGDWVELGQKIASMGQSDSNTVQLHFEIRQDGKPVEPLKYLPKR